MSGLFERLGVVPIVNGKGPATRLSGGIMRPEVAAAMAEASRVCVDMAELQAAASRRIAGHTGAAAGIVTSGAAAGLLLGTAACVAGLDPAAMNRLPDTTGRPDEVLMVRSQRNAYDHAVRTTGARIVEVGLADRLSGAGVRDAEPWEIAAALTERTAALLWVASPAARPPLEAVVDVARARQVPVIVDAAAQLPPASNLRRFVAAGADLVVFSGGKAIGGPQASGILCGRRDLIMAAALQMLDMDVFFDQFRPPAELIDRSRLQGLPRHGIGRPCKVGKEEILGLLTALDLFVADDPDARRAGWLAALAQIRDALGPLRALELELLDQGDVPALLLGLRRGTVAELRALALDLEADTPSIRLDWSRIETGRLLLDPRCLRPGDPERIEGGFRRRLAG